MNAVTPTPPTPDPAAASAAALAARRARATLKQQVRDGDASVLALVQQAGEHPASPAGSLRLAETLSLLPRVGPVALERILRELDIDGRRRLGGLGVRQRDRLAGWLQQRAEAPVSEHRGTLVVLAGPTAVGKGTVAEEIRRTHPEIRQTVSATTRARRPGEIDGIHYRFVDDAEFDRMIARDELLEWAVVHNQHRYGTPRADVDAALARGENILLEIDLQGARQVRAATPDAFLVFLAPPSWDELVRRLVGRGTEGEEERERRLATARGELAAQGEFDAVVVNRDVPTAAKEVVDLALAPRRATRSPSAPTSVP